MFDPKIPTLEEYLSIDDGQEFPKEINIALAVCTKNCGTVEFIVDGSTQVCQRCGSLMFRTEVKKYRLMDKNEVVNETDNEKSEM